MTTLSSSARGLDDFLPPERPDGEQPVPVYGTGKAVRVCVRTVMCIRTGLDWIAVDRRRRARHMHTILLATNPHSE